MTTLGAHDFDCAACPIAQAMRETVHLHEQRIAELEIALAKEKNERARSDYDYTVARSRLRRGPGR